MLLRRLTMIGMAVFCVVHTIANNTNFRYLQPKDGLIDGEVNSIVQDKEGLMWFATWSGLIRYDGYNYTYFKPELGNPSSLPDKKVKKLFVDSENNLWVVTSRGLCLFLENTHTFRQYHFENASPTGIIISNLMEVNGNLIIHTHDNFYIIPLSEKDKAGYHAKLLPVYDSENQVSPNYEYCTAFNNTLYFISNNSLQNTAFVYSAKLENVNQYPEVNIHRILKLETQANYIEYVKPENNLYIGTRNGIEIYSLTGKNKISTRYFPGSNIQRIIYTSDNKIYCSTLSPELLFVNLHSGKTGKYQANPFQYGTLLNSVIHVLYEDFSGNLWIGHQGQGISILNLYQKTFYSYHQNPFNKHSLTGNKVTCFGGTEKEIFVGVRTGGLNLVDKSVDSYSKPVFKTVKLKLGNKTVPFNEGIWDIEKASDNLFWVGSDAGLLKLYKKNNEWVLTPFSSDILLNNTIRKVYVDKNDNIWCAALNAGLILIPNPEENKTKSYFQYKTDISDDETISDNTILTIDIDDEERFWIGTVNGLNLLKIPYNNIDLSGKVKPDLKFKRFVAYRNDSNYLNNNEINCLYENFDGKIWIGTQGGGINIWDPETNLFSHLTTDNNLPDDNILGMLADETGKIWISTKKGIASVNMHDGKLSVTKFTTSDGLQGEIFMVNSYYKSLDGEIFFGGDNGFTCFYPKNIKSDTIKPKIIFTDLKFANNIVHVGDTIQGRQILFKNINETNKIVLPYKHKTFSIGVAALHYQYPEENKITYLLKGYDRKWRTIPAIYRNIYYSNLPPGTYTLKTKAISSDNVASVETKILTIEVLRPWYLTWYVILLFILIAIALMGSLIYIIVNRQRLIYEKKESQIVLENNENKMLFLTNIAHGLKTPLSLVVAPISDLMQNYQDIKPEWKNHLNLIQRNSNYLLQLINQIVDFRKLNAGKLILYKQKTDIVKIIREVVFNFKSFEKSQHVQLTLDIPFNALFVWVDPQKIEEVLYNLLSNAFKHTSEGRNISVTLSINQQSFNNKGNPQLVISVFNEGTVIQEKDRKKIFERFYKTDENIEGTGIGLSFSKSLVELHHGKIEAEPVEGKGMAFNVYLPYIPSTVELDNTVIEIEDNLETEYDEYESHVTDPPDVNKKETIVLVEDNDELRAFMKQVLSRNYLCLEAINGEEGLKIIKNIIPDIVISDIIMPDKDGYQLCKEVKEDQKTCHIPVILLTAKTSQEQIITGYKSGADAYITKPFDLEIVTSQISRLIKNRELIRRKYQNQNFMVEISETNFSKDDEFIMNFRSILEKNITDPSFNVKSVAESMNVSSTQLYRKIKALTGYSPVEFIRIIKLQSAYELLLKRNNSVKEICYLSGFNNISYFIKCFRGHFGVTPANLKENGSVHSENSK